MTTFSGIESAPRDPILGLTEAFLDDQRENKVNLGVGVYQDDAGKVPLLACVTEAERRMAANPRPRSYLPIDGAPAYRAAVTKLVLGDDPDLTSRVVSLQALGGTGALRVGAGLLQLVDRDAPLLVSDPSWENHQALFTRAGFNVGTYRYYDAERRGVDAEGMLADLRAAQPGTVVVLHARCHNPTGYELTPEQWDAVIAVMDERGLVPFLDLAYQGFAEGVDEDAYVVRKFAATGMEFLVASSFSKSFSLYGERVGALLVVCADAETAKRVLSQVKVVVRTLYSNPPTHGAMVVAEVLDHDDLRAQWLTELGGMRDRVKQMRQALVDSLAAHGVSQDMSFITEQVGMFSYSGLTKDQMVALREQHAVYGLDTGRLCVAALNTRNVDRVGEAVAQVL